MCAVTGNSNVCMHPEENLQTDWTFAGKLCQKQKIKFFSTRAPIQNMLKVDSNLRYVLLFYFHLLFYLKQNRQYFILKCTSPCKETSFEPYKQGLILRILFSKNIVFNFQQTKETR